MSQPTAEQVSGADDPSRTDRRPLALLKRGLLYATESHVLFPLVAVLVLAGIWGTTLNLIATEHHAAERRASASARELAETYQAQVLRSLREIDQTLKLVRYEYAAHGASVLGNLRSENMLPPPLVFGVSITDGKGRIVASTRSGEVGGSIDRQEFRSDIRDDELRVSLPKSEQTYDRWYLQFSRRLTAADGKVAGIVAVRVDADYFVSGYDFAKLGKAGMLGLVGTDGVFRIRRSGDSISTNGRVDYPSLLPSTEGSELAAGLSVNAWDDVRRYTSVSPIYGFPLAVIVGLSEQEQLADARQSRRLYLWRATGSSLVILVVVAILGYLSRQLALSRQQAMQEHVSHAARVEYLAFHDGLTTLPNRSLFSRLLVQALSQARRHNRQLAVLFLDLDRFKYINDTLGHEAGDQLLREVANRLKECLRDSDTVARLGGDEFVILLPEIGSERFLTIISQKIISAVAQPFTLFGHEFRITASIGISVYPQDGLDERSLTKNADIAMYQAKKSGKNNFQFYSDRFNAASLERLTLEAGLRRALEQNQFILHYQARRDIDGGRITGLEALLRWQHPELGMVPPMEFIPVAEDTGLIVPIGRWVLRTVCRQVAEWQAAGLPAVTMAVNMSEQQFFDKDLLADVADILAETGMDSKLLELEIAEGLLICERDKTLRVLRGLREMGVRIAIDDFGTGYSSLASLERYPLNTVKIDRSFIRELPLGDGDKSMTEAIIAIGKILSLTVVAQGVETKEQVEYLRQNDCNEFQGFYFNRPLPAGEVADLLRANFQAAGGESKSLGTAK